MPLASHVKEEKQEVLPELICDIEYLGNNKLIIYFIGAFRKKTLWKVTL
jgi:hypothetical protein